MIPEEYLNQIVTGDARELAKRMPDKCASLAFADPPYWVNFKYGNKRDSEFAYIEPIWLVSEMIRVSEVVLITPSIGWMYSYPKPDWVIAWYKPAAMGRNYSGGVNSWEPILVYGRPRIDIDVIKVQVGGQNDASFHSCPKPLNLMLYLVEKYSKPSELVIDFLAGSGTTCKAAKMLGRRWIGFEIDAATAEKARERVAHTQSPLFVTQPEQLTLEER